MFQKAPSTNPFPGANVKPAMTHTSPMKNLFYARKCPTFAMSAMKWQIPRAAKKPSTRQQKNAQIVTAPMVDAVQNFSNHNRQSFAMNAMTTQPRVKRIFIQPSKMRGARLAITRT